MRNLNRLVFLFLLLSTIQTQANAVEKALGTWSSFMPYNTAYGLCTDGSQLFVITENAFFIGIDPVNQQYQTYNKVSGMSDIGMNAIGYDYATSNVVLAYTDGNIDVFKNNTFYNIPDFMIKTITGTKSINGVYCSNGIAYLSTSIGVLALNLSSYTITETYQFIVNNQIVPIYGFTRLADSFYAITDYGLYQAPASSPELQNFQVWSHVDSTDAYTSVVAFNNSLILSNSSKVYSYQSHHANLIYKSANTISHVDTGLSRFFVSESNPTAFTGIIHQFSPSFSAIDSVTFSGFPAQVAQTNNGKIWFANTLFGLEVWAGSTYTYGPAGPNNKNSVGIYANKGDLWIVHGGYSDIYLPDNNGSDVSHFDGSSWKSYSLWGDPIISDSIADLVNIVKDETDGTIYASSYGGFGNGGLLVIGANGPEKVYKNDVFERCVSSGGWEVNGLCLDNNHNLWADTYTSSYHELYCREKTTGNWYKYHINLQRNPANDGGPIVADDYGEIWYVCQYGQGILVYNPNGTLADTSDDVFYHLSTGVGSGNLPSNNTYSVAKDLTDNIWIGTDNGIAIVYQAGSCASSRCDAVIPIVQYDAYAGYLFAGQNVRAIAVDGANRKWVGTDNGVWLLSPDASSIIYQFNASNSPLPSNRIQSIGIDKTTGDVYIGTDQGLVSYRSTATQGGDTNSNELIFPNPVPAGYSGQIAIRGLVSNADVRITDISGQLVYRTTAFGGQATWNGFDYKGHRPESGVYLVFVTNTSNSLTNADPGSQTFVGKIVFMQ